MKPRGGVRTLALVCVLLLAAACGSTSKQAQQQTDDDPSASASASLSPGGSAAPGASGGATSSGTVGIGGGTGGVGAGPLATSPPALVGKTGRGVTQDTIKIGVFVSKNLQNAFLAVGLVGGGGGGGGSPKQTNNEEKFLNDVIIKDMNARGGIAGRKIVPVYWEYDATNTDGNYSTQAQAGCEHFTQDNQVFAVLAGTVGGNDVLLDCLAKKGVPLIAQHHWPYDNTYYDKYPGLLFQPSRMRPERWVPAYIDGLNSAGFFKGAKIGLLRFDDPPFERMAAGMKKRLATHGLKLTDEAAMDTPTSLGDFGVVGSQISNAILSFRSKGVDRVIFAEYAGIIPFLYVTTAENQGYHARLGFSTVDIPATVNGQADEAQMTGSVAVSWIPGFDVSGAQDTRTTPSILACKALFKKAGFTIWSGLYMGAGCESWSFIKYATERSLAFSSKALETAINGVGTSYDSPFSLKTTLSAGHHDGGSAWRLARHQHKCDCMVYEGPLHPVP